MHFWSATGAPMSHLYVWWEQYEGSENEALYFPGGVGSGGEDGGSV